MLAAITRIHKELKNWVPHLLTIIVPRQPSRGQIIMTNFQQQGCRVAVRSKGHQLSRNIDVYVADTLGSFLDNMQIKNRRYLDILSTLSIKALYCLMQLLCLILVLASPTRFSINLDCFRNFQKETLLHDPWGVVTVITWRPPCDLRP